MSHTVQQDTVVSFHYRLSDAEGNELENNFDAQPTAYLHGHRNLFQAMEAALEGKQVGDELEVTLTPEQAYGPLRDNACQKVPIKHLLGKPRKLQAGQLVKVNTEKGAVDGTVVKAGRFMVDVDFNHPLAGKTLTFAIRIADIREASADERAHGHAHGPGGHQH